MKLQSLFFVPTWWNTPPWKILVKELTFFQFQAFLSELYVYLVDQMHVGLNKVLSVEDQAPVPEPLTDSAQLKHFAREAEVNENYELAIKYYQEVREFSSKADSVF